MSRVPGWLLRHLITVEPYLGDSAYGPQYGPPAVAVPALVSAAVRQVRGADGREVVSSTTVIAAPGLDCPPGSRLTLPDGRTTTAITTSAHAAPGLPVPACVEVSCE
ncbi:hypothetical protein CG747_12625 [Streptomyces sp. CB02959]|uniref:hypothetical protein n=1 Tax=Streptomyces sp. CB02959 TaxID=2020330 RepID=UPI000C27DFEC|nr:hypothetical protein [Streptomyces sp. CB02959]PJN40510.1 hypothetical protein CG747_12625 [Streptomyces sp. CB02959]